MIAERPRWEQAIRRNFPPFAMSLATHVEWRGLSIGPVNWKRGHEVAVKRGAEQSSYFMDADRFYVSNVGEVITSINPEFEAALDAYNNEIHAAVRVVPGTTREDFARLDEQHELVFLLMVIGYDLAGDIRAAIEKSIPDLARLESYIAVASEETAVERERTAMKAGTGPVELAREFGYLHQDYLGKPWTEEDYRKALSDGATAPAPYAETPDLSGHDDYQRWLLTMFKKNLYLYEEGRNAMVRCCWAMKETVAALGDDPEKLLYMKYDEVKEYGKGAPMISDETRAKRYEAYGAEFEGDDYQEMEGLDAVNALIEKHGLRAMLDDTGSAATELKGRVAFKGYAKGKARIVKNQQDADKVEDGDILISPMTQVEFLSGIRKCGAIVTDEGGIVCHAAIVAREFSKPCLLATKEATRVFKDGDLIEVDVTAGVVRKI